MCIFSDGPLPVMTDTFLPSLWALSHLSKSRCEKYVPLLRIWWQWDNFLYIVSGIFVVPNCLISLL